MDKLFMTRAITLARGGLGKVSPNPMVGTVITKGREVISEGFHKFYGDSHAEVHAINSASESLIGATLYCNLEPCSKSYPGKINPPCCDSIIKSGITKVVIAQLDPNPMVSGSGIARLKEAGIDVVTGVCSSDALELNRGFNSVMINKRPYIHIKWAQSLDGKIATKSGVSKWITSEECRKETHKYRSMCDGILVGRRTVVLDNPTLDARYGFSPSPRPVVIDSNLQNDPNLKVYERNPIIFCNKTSEGKKSSYKGEKIELEGSNYNIMSILGELMTRGINSIFVEGGSNLISQFLSKGLWDRVTVYTAPKLLGDGLSPVDNIEVTHPKDALKFASSSFKILDNHIVFNGYREESK